MLVLILRRGDKSHSKFDTRFENVPPDLDVELHKLTSSEQSNLKQYLQQFELSRYDRVVTDLKWQKIKKQAHTLRSIPHLIMNESDTWFNFIRFSSNYKAFQRFYRKIPGVRVIVTGWHAADDFRKMGIEAHYAGKSYDSSYLDNLHLERTINYGFIGTTGKMIYRQRDFLLRQFEKSLGLEIMRTFSKEDYLNRLNSIRFFISADRGMREYMIKNFEALGCGCILVAFRQDGEEVHLGFRDMENVILYSRVDEALDKIKRVESDPCTLERIANAGYQLARERFTTQNRDRRLFEIITLPYK